MTSEKKCDTSKVNKNRDIVNWSAGITISPLSYYRCCDNLYQVRTIVNYQIRWSAIFTLAHKHKSSAILVYFTIPKRQMQHDKTDNGFHELL